MFYKKYVFETKQTRSKRVLRSILFIGFAGCVVFALMCVYLPIFAQNQNERTELAFFQRSPDVIAVFTGDSGRIDYTLKKAESYPSAKVFITGVYAKNSLKTLLHRQGRAISVDEYLDEESHHIEIDYLARNTIENGLYTLRFLKTLKQNNNLLIISNDYHMFRISQIMQALNDDPELEIYYESIETDYRQWENIKKLMKEVYKYFKTTTFLLFWDREQIS
ncbi:MAG: hypothetical protein CME62_00485 [Halobacteriovoraceae bacterium]|nr:hypothetical protein [Halobacteriovoraceae bacterium]